MHEVETDLWKINVNMVVVNHFPIVIYKRERPMKTVLCGGFFIV